MNPDPESPALNLVHQELDHPTSVFDLTNTHAAEWEQIPAARLNIWWKALKQAEAIKAAD